MCLKSILKVHVQYKHDTLNTLVFVYIVHCPMSAIITHVRTYVHVQILSLFASGEYVCESEFLICLKARAKLEQWLVCAPLGIHLELIIKALMLLVTI